jgi:hypothetical protein
MAMAPLGGIMFWESPNKVTLVRKIPKPNPELTLKSGVK